MKYLGHLVILISILLSIYLLKPDPIVECQKSIRKLYGEITIDEMDDIQYFSNNCEYLNFYFNIQSGSLDDMKRTAPENTTEVTKRFFWKIVWSRDSNEATWFYE